MTVKRLMPPAVIIHGLADAEAVLAAGRPVCWLSAPGAAGYGGPAWWRALIGRIGRPGWPDLLDCGEDAAWALEALRLGCEGLVLSGGAVGFERVREAAAECGATLWPSPPPALNMADRRARWRLDAWLGTQSVQR